MCTYTGMRTKLSDQTEDISDALHVLTKFCASRASPKIVKARIFEARGFKKTIVIYHSSLLRSFFFRGTQAHNDTNQLHLHEHSFP